MSFLSNSIAACGGAIQTNNVLSDVDFDVAFNYAENIVTYLRSAYVDAYIVGGALRHKVLGGGTADVDIAILCTLREYDNVRMLLPDVFELQHDRAYEDNDGFLADYRYGDVNIIVYDESTYPTVDRLVGRFDMNINQFYLDPETDTIVNKHLVGDVVKLNPLRGMEFYRERMIDRVEKFKGRLPNLDWSDVDSRKRECILTGYVYYEA